MRPERPEFGTIPKDRVLWPPNKVSFAESLRDHLRSFATTGGLSKMIGNLKSPASLTAVTKKLTVGRNETMSAFDWNDARQTLTEISKREVESFLQSDRSRNLYGIGYHCHNSYGDVLLVANTIDCHEKSYRNYVERFGPCDEDQYKWHIGSWQYPAGIDTGECQQSAEYRNDWEPFRKVVEDMTMAGADDHPGPQLREFCCEVLKTLIRNGVFNSRLPDLGFTVMDVDDPDGKGIETKTRFDEVVREAGPPTKH